MSAAKLLPVFGTTSSEADVACICERTLSTAMSGEQDKPACEQVVVNAAANVHLLAETVAENHDSLKYHLLGPSLTKAGQDSVDQRKVRKHSSRVPDSADKALTTLP